MVCRDEPSLFLRMANNSVNIKLLDKTIVSLTREEDVPIGHSIFRGRVIRLPQTASQSKLGFLFIRGSKKGT
jgi:hypothetical protein